MRPVASWAYDEIERQVCELAEKDGARSARRMIKKGAATNDADWQALLVSCRRGGRFGFLGMRGGNSSILRHAASVGQPQACEMLADDHRLGRNGASSDIARARKLYQLAAEGGIARAAGWLAWYEWFGMGGPCDKEAAFGHARAAVQGGDLNGYRIGALIQAQGYKVPGDALLAVQILREVLEQEPEDVFALRELGRILCDPLGEYGESVCRTEASAAEGLRLLREAASLGDVAAKELVSIACDR